VPSLPTASILSGARRPSSTSAHGRRVLVEHPLVGCPCGLRVAVRHRSCPCSASVSSIRQRRGCGSWPRAGFDADDPWSVRRGSAGWRSRPTVRAGSTVPAGLRGGAGRLVSCRPGGICRGGILRWGRLAVRGGMARRNSGLGPIDTGRGRAAARCGLVTNFAGASPLGRDRRRTLRRVRCDPPRPSSPRGGLDPGPPAVIGVRRASSPQCCRYRTECESRHPDAACRGRSHDDHITQRIRQPVADPRAIGVLAPRMTPAGCAVRRGLERLTG